MCRGNVSSRVFLLLFVRIFKFLGYFINLLVLFFFIVYYWVCFFRFVIREYCYFLGFSIFVNKFKLGFLLEKVFYEIVFLLGFKEMLISIFRGLDRDER